MTIQRVVYKYMRIDLSFIMCYGFVISDVVLCMYVFKGAMSTYGVHHSCQVYIFIILFPILLYVLSMFVL